jgi:hypothetical protein
VSNVDQMQACRNGHVMTADEQVCLVCGAHAMGEPDRPEGLLPPFDPERFRGDKGAAGTDTPARTVPVWVLVVVVVLGLAAGVVVGAVR